MPIQYPDAPQFQAPNLNLLGAYAQGQALASNTLRDQVMQNQLAEFERKRAIDQQLMNVTGAPDFNLSSPEAVRRLQGLDLDAAMKVKAAQEMAAYHAAATANQTSHAAIRAARYKAEVPGIEAETAHKITTANTGYLDLHSKKITAAQDILSRTDPETWAEDHAAIMKLDPQFASHLPPPDKFDQKKINKSLMSIDMTRNIIGEELKARIPKVMAPTENMPGMIVGPGGVEKLPQVAQGSTAWGPEVAAPVVRPQNAMAPTAPAAPVGNNMGRLLSPEAMSLPPEAKDIQDTMAVEQQIQQNAPIGREKEALGKYRFGKTLKGMGNTFIDLAKNSGIVVPGETPEQTFEALANQSKAGKILGKLDASERLALVDQLKSQIVTAIPQFAAAAGLQSKNFDSEKEGERLMRALADPDNIANISSAFRILNDLNTQFGTGKPLFEAKKEIGGILGLRGQTKTPNAPKKLEGAIDFGAMD